MKKRKMKNRIYTSVLLAVLLQSVLFGIFLAATGIYATIEKEPYLVLSSQTEEKNKQLSIHMNNALLEGNDLSVQVARQTQDAQIHTAIVESLSRQSSISGIFYADMNRRTCAFYSDTEPEIYSVGYGDITNKVGTVEADFKIALDSTWKPNMTEKQWQDVENHIAVHKNTSAWYYRQDALYYVTAVEKQGNVRLTAIELSGRMIDQVLNLKQPAYDGMQCVVMLGNNILFGGEEYDAAFTDGTALSAEANLTDEKMLAGEAEAVATEADDENLFRLSRGEEQYVGVREQLQNYGQMQDKLYVGVLCRESAIKALGREVTLLVFTAYLISILLASIVAYSVLRMIMRPLNRLHDDIEQQNIPQIHFEPTGTVEIDLIYESLNDMMKKLQQSYGRYSMAMEAAEKNMGSFEYVYGRDIVILSPSMQNILSIPQELFEKTDQMSIENWTTLLMELVPVDNTGVYLYHREDHEDMYVGIKTKDEHGGMFGMVIDKTDEYLKISHLRYISEHDPLTELYNGAYFKREAQRLLDIMGWRLARKTVHAVAFCDLDNLKAVNDSYGHTGGDQYLRAMAEWIRGMTERENAIAARISGDEFVILFYGYDDTGEIRAHIGNAYRNRQEVTLQSGGTIKLSASIGVAFYTGKGGDIETLLKQADQAMYERKRGSKDGIAFFEEMS